MDCNSILRKYSRYLLIVFNFLFVLTGVVILSVGASVKAYYNEYTSFLDDKYIYASDLLIIIGVIIFIIAFFGCCGALKENACMTQTFSMMLIVIFILELIVGIGGLVLKHQTDEMIDKALTGTLRRYNTPNNTEITNLWDTVQENFQCCGIQNYTDWENVTSTHGQLPVTCCNFPHGSFGNVTCNEKSEGLHREGCLEVFSDYIEGHATTVESVGLTFAIIQLLGIILSCYLAKQIRSDYETV
ncbi:CD63 antigen-like [Tribolium madens]|uniref:CD63 antigen-like n=1 Tax=Tribolium madens TaxID=41895 RepID=UPI001CF74CD6|nr:CD63 antigen-like [Tribolium madens]